MMRTCCICGNSFESIYKRTLTCSPECSRKYRNRTRERQYTEEQKQRRKEYDRQKYLKSHPDARTSEEIHQKKLIKEVDKERKREERAKILAQKEAIKQANIAMYLEYEREHECCVCHEKYIAHHPFSKYCSQTCARKATRTHDSRHRYKNKTIDKGITLRKLADRDHNQCQICGLFVDWSDYIKTDRAVICGDMYPSIDHITPISLGGLHAWDNVQLAHRGCNTRKSNRYIG